ncbi:MAG: L,D-transpeptidase [Xanthobacteraceae bacterium]|nr:L,D-transpeptidase [Xanthobacteraceae bacterium]
MKQVPAGTWADFPSARGRASRLCATALLSSAVVLASLAPAMAWSPDSWPPDSWPPYSGSDEMVFEPDTPPPPRPVRHRRPRAARVKVKETVAPTRKPHNPVIVTVSIKHQSLKVYDADGLFAETPVSTGMPGHATPLGIFSVIQKNKWHRSNIYSGAPMPYMQRLTWSGIAMHAGVLPGYPASHGCIRMPNRFATELWGWTRMGARVVVTANEVSPVPISHPLLATRKPEPAPPPAPEPAQADAKGDTATTAIAIDLADLRPSLTSAVATVTEPTTTGLASSDAAPAPAAAPPTPKRSGPIAVFISGKDARLYVRQNFAPLFDVPITVAPGDRPLGTHVFTAQAVTAPGDGDRTVTFRWSALSLPVEARARVASHHAARQRQDLDTGEIATATHAGTATEALDRLTIPAETATRLAEALTTGSSIIVSDQGLNRNETGLGTDFIVPLR